MNSTIPDWRDIDKYLARFEQEQNKIAEVYRKERAEWLEKVVKPKAWKLYQELANARDGNQPVC